jgi:hypothetical protein
LLLAMRCSLAVLSPSFAGTGDDQTYFLQVFDFDGWLKE